MQVYDRSKESGWTPAHKRWAVRWRDGDGRQRKRAFEYKADAQAFANDLGGRPLMRDQKRTVGDQWRTWRAIRGTRSAGHQANLDGQWERHLEPTWGDVRLATIRHGDVAAWVTDLERIASPSTARKALAILSSLCRLAIRDDVINRNPCDGLTVKVRQHREQVILSREQLEEVAQAMGPDAIVVRVLGLTGLRWGEMAGLRVHDLDASRRRIYVRRHVTEVGGHLEVIEGTKTDHGRTVTAPADLLAELSAVAKGRPKTDPLLPAARGGIRRHSRFFKRWHEKVQAPKPKTPGGPGGLGLDMHIHDLRHTAASLMIQSGADVKVIQRQLGHKSATLSLDLYGHMFEDSLDRLSDAMAGKA